MHGYKVSGPPVVGQPEIYSTLAFCVKESVVFDPETHYRDRREMNFTISMPEVYLLFLRASSVHEDFATERLHTPKQQTVEPTTVIFVTKKFIVILIFTI